jgi:hypothetical protein
MVHSEDPVDFGITLRLPLPLFAASTSTGNHLYGLVKADELEDDENELDDELENDEELENELDEDDELEESELDDELDELDDA